MTEWISLTRETPVDPARRIVDAHHHLWAEGHRKAGFTYTGGDEPAYLPQDFHGDMAGHDVIGSIFVQCAIAYRDNGPEHLRPIGETEFIAGLAHGADWKGPPLLGIVGYADLSRTDLLDEVLDAQEEASGGLFRGIRQMMFEGTGPGGNPLIEPAFRQGLHMLGTRGLTFDAMINYTQLGDLARLAPQVEGTTIVVDHLGTPMLRPGGPARDEVTAAWKDGIRGLAPHRNVQLKLGGLGMERVYGMTWTKQDRPPTSDMVCDRWQDEVRFCIDTLGPERCMFESNFPVDRWAVGYTVLWNAFQKMAATYTDEEQDALFSRSAIRAYRLSLADGGGGAR